MSPLRWRPLVFLIGCVFAVFGTCGIVFGGTRWATIIGGVSFGLSLIMNLAQVLFKFPLEFSRRKSTQRSKSFLPFSDQRKQQDETPGIARDALLGWPTRQVRGTLVQVSQPHFSKVQLIPVVSSARSLKKRQTARRDQTDLIFSVLGSLMVVGQILVVGLMILTGYTGFYRVPVKIDPHSSDVQLVQKYCDALEKQDYARAFSYFDQSEGGAIVGSQTLTRSAFVNLARSVDQQGRMINCSIKDEVQTQEPCLPNHSAVSCPPPTYVLTMQIIRSHHAPYLLNAEVEVDLQVTLIVSLDKL